MISEIATGLLNLSWTRERTPKSIFESAQELGREFVIQVQGTVIERESKNPNITTGAIEVLVEDLKILNPSKTPPFTIENETDGGEELRMQYRYLDLRRNPVKSKSSFQTSGIHGSSEITFLKMDLLTLKPLILLNQLPKEHEILWSLLE